MSIASPRRRPRRVTSASNGHAEIVNHTTPVAEESCNGATGRKIPVAQPATLPSVPGQKLPALLWGVDAATWQTSSLEFVASLAKAEKGNTPPRSLADLWRQCSAAPGGTVGRPAPTCGDVSTCGDLSFETAVRDPLRILACARSMPALTKVADAGDWWAALDRLAAISRAVMDEPASDFWTQQALGGELALTVAYHFSEVASCADLGRRGREVIERSLVAGLDDEGLARESPPEQWLPLLASWTRSRMLVHASNQILQPDAAGRYQDFVESLLRLAGRDGWLALPGHEHSASPRQRDLWLAAAMFVDRRLQRALQCAWNKAAGTRSVNAASAAELPPASMNSERAGLAVLRPSWSAPRLVVDYRRPRLRLRLERNDEVCLAGDCELFVALDGRELVPKSPWEENCWITDDDVDYLELRLSLAEGVCVERHILFARSDEFVFVADAVLGEKPAAIEYRASLPMAAGISVNAVAETRELALVKEGRHRAAVLPLALGEWRTDRARGNLAIDSNCLCLTQAASQAACLFAPWFIDLSPKRVRRKVTWRRLTVAEDRIAQPDDVAVGYRVQAGQEQWLFYRSLVACGNRTLLGHNLVSEFLAARFSRKGVPETLIEIAAPADDDE
jgi:hypothetical protein